MVTSILPVSLSDSTPISALQSQRPVSPAKFHLDDVLVRAQAGDHDAFSQLYLRHKKRVFAICIGIVHDFSLAEDLTQETFLRLHLKLTSFRGDSLFTTWLHRMAVNIVLMRLRKRALPVVSLDQLMGDFSQEHVRPRLGTCDRAQAGVVDRIAIERAVNALPPSYRKFFLLHDVHGLEHREIASMEGCSRSASKSQVHRARLALRGAISAKTRRPLPD